jgi:hypothetical protein
MSVGFSARWYELGKLAKEELCRSTRRRGLSVTAVRERREPAESSSAVSGVLTPAGNEKAPGCRGFGGALL